MDIALGYPVDNTNFPAWDIAGNGSGILIQNALAQIIDLMKFVKIHLIPASIMAIFAGNPAIAKPTYFENEHSVNHVQDGKCTKSSHIEEGTSDKDTVKKAFNCDEVHISFLKDYEGHGLVEFKEKNTGNIVAFEGFVHKDGLKMGVNRIYLKPNEPIRTIAGSCRFIFRGKDLASLFCTGAGLQSDRRKIAVITMHLTP